MKKNWMIYLVLFVAIGIISGCGQVSKVTVPKTSVVKKPTIKITSITISPAVYPAVHKETGEDFLSDDFYEDSEENEIYDPFEAWNRGVFVVNDVLYDHLLFPLADGYHYVMRDIAQKGVSNFFDNLSKPLSSVANILQGNFEDAVLDVGAFFVNSTWGIGGLLDIVKEDDNKDSENISQVFANWRIPEGPYIVWPIFGPSNIRNSFGTVGDILLTPQTYLGSPDSLYMGLGDTIQDTAQSNPYRDLTEGAIDPYMSIKNAYYDNFEARVKR